MFCSLHRFLIHCLPAIVAISLAGAASHGRADETTNAGPAGAPERDAEVLDKAEVFRRIGVFEDAARKADSLHLDHQTMIKIYQNLGILYDVAGMFPRAEAAMRRAIELMKDGPQADLAEQYNSLSTIHSLMGNFRQAEKDQTQALAIREKIGDSVGIAITWVDMAGLYCQERKFKNALEYAQKSYDVLANRTDMRPSNHIAVLQTLAVALCGTRQAAKAIPIMKQAVDESVKAFGANSLSAAGQGFAMGYVYWQAGDTGDAAEWMGRSLKNMKTYIGWGAPLYMNSMAQYVRFLHQTGKQEAASNAESEIHRIESVVDARTLTTRGGEFLSPGR